MSEERCGARGPLWDGVEPLVCTAPVRHIEDHYDQMRGQAWPKEPVSPPQLEDGPDYVIPDTVRMRVDLHRAQAAYDLTVLRDRINTMGVVTSTARGLRARREQLTAELDAWTYLAKMARSPR